MTLIDSIAKLKQRYLSVLIICIIFSIASFLLRIYVPYEYTSEGKYQFQDTSLSNNQTQNQIGTFPFFGNANTLENKYLIIEKIQSKVFFDTLLEDEYIKKWFASFKNFNITKKTEIFNEEKTDNIDTQIMYLEYLGSLSLSIDSRSGVLNSSYKSRSPIFSAYILSTIKDQINHTELNKDLRIVKSNISYFQDQLSIALSQDLINFISANLSSELVKESKIKSSENYILDTINPPQIDLKPDGIGKAISIILGAVLGFLISLILVIFRILK